MDPENLVLIFGFVAGGAIGYFSGRHRGRTDALDALFMYQAQKDTPQEEKDLIEKMDRHLRDEWFMT